MWPEMPGEDEVRGAQVTSCLPRGCEEQLRLAARKITTLGSRVLVKSKSCWLPLWLFCRNPQEQQPHHAVPGDSCSFVCSSREKQGSPSHEGRCGSPHPAPADLKIPLVFSQALAQPGCEEGHRAARGVAQPLGTVASPAGSPGPLSAGSR